MKKAVSAFIFVILAGLAIGVGVVSLNNNIISKVLDGQSATATTTQDCSALSAAAQPGCWLSKATRTQNASLCSKTSNANNCLAIVATRSGNSQLCNSITDAKKKDSCLKTASRAASIQSNVTKNEIDKCAKLPPNTPQSVKEQCTARIAALTKSADRCATLSTKAAADCYTNLARHTGDATLCSRITDAKLADKCRRLAGG